MAEVVFDRVTKRFGDVVAVDALSLEVRDGEFMVLLGPSGCGKTTALRLIAGLEPVSDGALRIGERTVNDVQPKDRDVSMVFQSYALYPHLNVARNIESPLLARRFTVAGEAAPRKLTRAERDQRVQQTATSLGLADLLDRKPAALSGGQRQRVALARAIVSRPAAFLMDEPLSNLDAKLRAQTRLELVELHRQLGTTFVYVTHDQVEAMTMADRIAVMDGGRLQQVGPPHEVYARPRNLFVARFLGSPPMNTLPARIVVADGVAAAAVDGHGSLPLGPLGEGAPADGTAVVVGIRPEHVVLEMATTGSAAAAPGPDSTGPDGDAGEPAAPDAGAGSDGQEVAEADGPAIDPYAPAGGEGAAAAPAAVEAGDGPSESALAATSAAEAVSIPTAVAEATPQPYAGATADPAPEPVAEPPRAPIDAPDGTLVARVVGLEWLGHEQLVVCAVGEHRLVARQAADGPDVTLDATVWLRVRSPGDLHLFDPTTTERIG